MIIHNGCLICFDEKNRVIENGAVVMDKDKIIEVGKSEPILQKYRRTGGKSKNHIDAKQRVILPGLINIHMHLYSTFARGLMLKSKPPRNFTQVLDNLWWKLDQALDDKAIYYSALVALIDCIKNGVTTIFDHHSSPTCIAGSLDVLADAMKETGLRAALSYEVTDRNGKVKAKQAIKENQRFLATLKANNPFIRGHFGLHASFTLSDNTLKESGQIGRELGVGFHVHCAEGKHDQAFTKRKFGKSVVQRFFEHGILGEQTIAAHCVHIDRKEMNLLSRTGTAVAHNPSSNTNNAVGCAPINGMVKENIKVGLGTDGMSSSMWNELKAGCLIHKHQNNNPGWDASPLFTALFKQNTAVASESFGLKLGRIEKGAVADVIIVDYLPPSPMDTANLLGHMLFGLSNSSVDTTIIGGKVLMKNREILGVDEQEIAAKARKVAQRVWNII